MTLFTGLLIGATSVASADEDTSKDYEGEVSVVVSEEKQAQELREDLRRIMREEKSVFLDDELNLIEKTNSTQEVPEYSHYDFVDIESKNVSGTGYAGNQPVKGTRFPTGGGFYWSNSGGPTVSPSVSFGGSIISISMSLGESRDSGTFANAPDTTNYFKLKAEKVYKVDKTAVYGYPATGGNRVFLYYIYPKTLQTETAWAEKQ